MKVMSLVAIIFIVCAMICGFWMKANPGKGDVNFHAGLSVAALIISLITIILYMIKK